MAPRTPPRTILDAGPGATTVGIMGPGGPGERVPVTDLKRPELIAAATLAYPGIRGDAWMRQSNPAIVDALVNANLPAGITDWAPPDPKHAKERAAKAARRAARDAGAPSPVKPVDNPARGESRPNGATSAPTDPRLEVLFDLLRGQVPDRRGADAALELTLAAQSLEQAVEAIRAAAAAVTDL